MNPGPAGAEIRRLDTTTSTNDDARAWAEAGAPHGATVTARLQTAGRGRLGRTWVAAAGTQLAMSVVVRGDHGADRVAWIPLGAAVAVAEALGPAVRIKWPNDLLAPDDRKLGGILCEAEWSQGRLRYAIVGIGVNVTDAPPGLPATSLAAMGLPAAAEDLAERVQASLLRALEQPVSALHAAWCARSATLGRRVRVGEVEGVAEALLDDGGLRIRRDDGRPDVIRSGDVSLVS